MLKPDYLTFDQVLQNRLFVIPNYQRAYSWTKYERKQLFEDIDRLSTQARDRHHFMSTIVCLSTKKIEEVGSNEFRVFDIVDGQQRLTTLIILLKTISYNLNRSKYLKEVEQLEELLVKPNKQLILLQTNHDDSAHVFSNFLKSSAIPPASMIKTMADKNLMEAFRDCKTYIDKWNNDEKLLDLLRIIKNRIGFIFYEITEESSVYTVFEVLNSRGLAVDWLDKCKSIIMGIAFEKLPLTEKEYHTNRLHQIWSSIYRVIGLRNIAGHEIVRFSATLKKTKSDRGDHLRRPLSVEDSIDYFREYCLDRPSQVIEISEWILEVVNALTDIYSNARLSAVSEILQARLLAVSINLLPSSKISDNDKKRILEQWERVTFRIFGLLRNDSRTKLGDYTGLACIIIDELRKSKTENITDYIISKIKYMGSGEYSIESAIEYAKGKNCYNGWEKELLYFMYRYEEHLSKQAGLVYDESIWIKIWSKSPQKSIEHIMPQSHKSSISITSDESVIDNLGNLCVLPPNDNSKAGNKQFALKKQIVYSKNSLLLMKELLDKAKWDISEINNREERLLNWAQTAWSDID